MFTAGQKGAADISRQVAPQQGAGCDLQDKADLALGALGELCAVERGCARHGERAAAASHQTHHKRAMTPDSRASDQIQHPPLHAAQCCTMLHKRSLCIGKQQV